VGGGVTLSGGRGDEFSKRSVCACALADARMFVCTLFTCKGLMLKTSVLSKQSTLDIFQYFGSIYTELGWKQVCTTCLCVCGG
jgi:hypothetical protein